jgi:hypothetical protein
MINNVKLSTYSNNLLTAGKIKNKSWRIAYGHF